MTIVVTVNSYAILHLKSWDTKGCCLLCYSYYISQITIFQAP